VKVDLPDAIFSLADTKNNPKDPSDLKLKVSLDAYQDDVFYGLYKQHTTEQNGVNKSYSLTLNLANPNNLKVLAGMPASVEIDLAKLESQLNNSIKLPIESVIQPDFIDNIGTERIVWRLNKQQQVEMVKVFVVGVSADNSIEVTGPIKPDDLIVINGFNYLSDGLPVEVINLAGVQP
jgi:hypothetical protein